MPPTPFDRRAFLRRAGLAGTALALGAARPPAVADEGLAPFLHGVASGDPTADGVILWTRVDAPSGAPVPVRWEVATDVGLTDVVVSGHATAEPARDHTVKVDARGLEPGRWYFYRFTALGRSSLIGRTRTAPRGAADHVRFGVVSCSNYQHGFFNAYARLAERNDLDAIVHLGDYLYEYQPVADGGYGEDEANLARPRRHEPPHEMVSLADYRTRHAQYRLDPDLRRLHQLYPWVTTWDDHESTNNSWREGAANHDPDTEGDWFVRKAAAQQAYAEWMPIRVDDPARIWRSLRYGDLLDLIVLDTRLERDEEIGEQARTVASDEIDDPERIMLSPEQLAWLKDRLSDPATAWKVIAQQVIMAPWNAGAWPRPGPTQDAPVPVLRDDGNAANPDTWDGYTAERRRVFDHIRGNDLHDIVVLTGDVHSSWAIDLTDAPLDPTRYNPATGEGAIGVEFVGTSVASGRPLPEGAPPETLLVIEQGTRADNPHVKWTNFEEQGYFLLDVTPDRAQADWYFVDTVLAPSDGETLAASWMSRRGDDHLTEASAPAPAGNPAPADPPADPPSARQPDPAPGAPSGPPLPATGAGAAVLGLTSLSAAGLAVVIRRRGGTR